jgi:hypothetical protein
MTILEQASQVYEGAKTMKDWLGSGAETVPWNLAQERANVCVRCPMNKPGSVATGAIADAIKKQVEIKNHLKLRVVGEKSLHHCEGCGCVLRLKIHIPIDKLGLNANTISVFPDNCWQKHEYDATHRK